jgi:hypothetical protein
MDFLFPARKEAGFSRMEEKRIMDGTVPSIIGG